VGLDNLMVTMESALNEIAMDKLHTCCTENDNLTEFTEKTETCYTQCVLFGGHQEYLRSNEDVKPLQIVPLMSSHRTHCDQSSNTGSYKIASPVHYRRVSQITILLNEMQSIIFVLKLGKLQPQGCRFFAAN